MILDGAAVQVITIRAANSVKSVFFAKLEKQKPLNLKKVYGVLNLDAAAVLIILTVFTCTNC